jgi:DNA polymerase
MTRYDGKIAVLALGYNGSVGSLRAMGYGEDLPDGDLLDIVTAWRRANPHIVRFWNRLENAFITGGKVGKFLSVEKNKKDRYIRLPSGRAICYHNCSRRVHVDQYGREQNRLTFASPQGYRAETYGGRLSENVTQAVARDLLAEALVRLVESGYKVVGHVHDEVLVEGEHSVEEISEIMCKVPSWAPGLPVGGAGFTTYRYKKD